MINHVQYRGKNTNAAKAETKSYDAHIFNAGISQKAFVIFLSENNQRGDNY